jgi:hypothetical protein
MALAFCHELRSDQKATAAHLIDVIAIPRSETKRFYGVGFHRRNEGNPV